MNGIRLAAIALASSLVLLAAGCDRAKEAPDDAATEAAPADTTPNDSGSAASNMGDTLGDTADRAGQAIDDAAITTAVKGKYLADDTLKGLDISVDTDKGTVKLTGTVQDEAAKQRATEIAQGVDGVVNVDNQLSVQAANPPSTNP